MGDSLSKEFFTWGFFHGDRPPVYIKPQQFEKNDTASIQVNLQQP